MKRTFNIMKTGALMVLYNPDVEAVEKAIVGLLPQVDLLCLVDNSSTSHEQHYGGRDNLHYIPLMENRGIAEAQNTGIRYLQEAGMDFVLFSDQDSLCDNGLVSALLKAYLTLEHDGHQIATVGPVPVNKKTGKPDITKQYIINDFEISGQRFLQMHSIKSSFSLTRLSTFDTVGCFEKELFIDGVDSEWCWRAMKQFGLCSFIVSDLKFQHFNGEDTKMPIKKSTPFRTYYQFRNYLVLRKRDYTPSSWKKKNATKFVIKSIAYPLFVSPRLKFLKSIIKGVKDGMQSEMHNNP